jgi:hypothetical protein
LRKDEEAENNRDLKNLSIGVHLILGRVSVRLKYMSWRALRKDEEAENNRDLRIYRCSSN